MAPRSTTTSKDIGRLERALVQRACLCGQSANICVGDRAARASDGLQQRSLTLALAAVVALEVAVALRGGGGAHTAAWGRRVQRMQRGEVLHGARTEWWVDFFMHAAVGAPALSVCRCGAARSLQASQALCSLQEPLPLHSLGLPTTHTQAHGGGLDKQTVRCSWWFGRRRAAGSGE